MWPPICPEATGRQIDYIDIPHEAFISEITNSDAPKDVVWILDYLFSTILDGRNAHLTDGVARALGRPPKDFADYAREIAASGTLENGSVNRMALPTPSLTNRAISPASPLHDSTQKVLNPMTYEWPLYFCLFLALWSAVVGGVFSAFSEFIMSGLLRADPAGGMDAMQQINLHRHQNPVCCRNNVHSGLFNRFWRLFNIRVFGSRIGGDDFGTDSVCPVSLADDDVW